MSYLRWIGVVEELCLPSPFIYNSLIGANGAGKTSILRTISGLVRPSAGKIEFFGQEIQKVPAQKIVAAGLSQVPECRHVFPG